VDAPLAGVAAVAKSEPSLAIVANVLAAMIHTALVVSVVATCCCEVPPKQNRATTLSTIDSSVCNSDFLNFLYKVSI
jgi:hypothetical protein